MSLDLYLTRLAVLYHLMQRLASFHNSERMRENIYQHYAIAAYRFLLSQGYAPAACVATWRQYREATP